MSQLDFTGKELTPSEFKAQYGAVVVKKTNNNKMVWVCGATGEFGGLGNVTLAEFKKGEFRFCEINDDEGDLAWICCKQSEGGWDTVANASDMNW